MKPVIFIYVLNRHKKKNHAVFILIIYGYVSILFKVHNTYVATTHVHLYIKLLWPVLHDYCQPLQCKTIKRAVVMDRMIVINSGDICMHSHEKYEMQ